MQKKYFSTKKISRIAIMSAISCVLMFIEFPLPFAPSFYKLDFSEVPVLIGGFAMGPLAAILIEALKIIINTLFSGTTTAYVGEFANFVIGCSLAVPAALIYKKEHNKKGAIIALAIGSITMVIVGFLLNIYVVIPAYVNLAHYPLSAIIDMGKAIFPIIDSVFLLVLCCTTPFNIVKATLVSLITFFLYKRVANFIK